MPGQGICKNRVNLYDFTFSFRLRSVYYYGVKQARACQCTICLIARRIINAESVFKDSVDIWS